MSANPNVILILVDDMGFSDLGITGSEIKTPNIDKLAQSGALMTSMYNCARCCPTRASLLSGLYPHSAGVGHMGANLGTPEYQGFLRNDAATIAEALRLNGYQTYMSGKWHVAGDFMAREVDSWRVGDVDHPTPCQRGFDEFYGIVDGVTNFFSPHYIMRNNSRIAITQNDYYFTDAITDEAITMMQKAVNKENPFFLYLAHAAPHWPLHARPEDIAKYEHTYQGGWDAIRTARHEAMNGSNCLLNPWDISPRDDQVIPWEDVAHKDWEARKMAVYAAMVDRMDQSIGRVMASLRQMGQLDNTLILFLSDNGGCAEFMAEDGWAKFFPDVTNDGRKITMGNIPNLHPGDVLTYQSYDKPWANVSNAPFRKFKHYVHEGGISTPMIAHWPDKIKQPRTLHQPCHVVDVLPTILKATNTPYPSELGGHEIQPLQGESFLDALDNPKWQREQPIYFEHEGNCAIRTNEWKLVRTHQGAWELYDMINDRTELHDLAHGDAHRARSMQKSYAAWADKTGVMDWNIALPKLLRAWDIADVTAD